MSGHRIRPSLISRPAPPSPKLKDSCDRCSTSKVRCTKGKPSCARCDKLGYTCFYSPARRVGRPYRPKGSTPEAKTTKESDHQSRAPEACFIDESVKHYPQINTLPTPADAYVDSSPSISPINHFDTPNTTWSNQDPPNAHYKTDPDCILVALDLISLLEVSATHLRNSEPIDDKILSATAQTIAAAIDRLCRILECSCSERAEVGIMVSAICMSIIDIHTVSIAILRRDYPLGVAQDIMTPWDSPNIGPAFETGAFLVLGELSEIAKVTLRFLEAYKVGNGPNGFTNGLELPVGILPSLAGPLRGQLQQIIIDASWSTGGPGR
ncbi:Aflatoxin biosynthesis regulatory protein [Penicillium nucicola]|uniref:Aflatoxin biosynthesis regulatory protein n=1 Tax=Penicillium nucicola TaxID=1850975 RepID=UPI00254501B3|nr:Aflatoxin biosynthesis regulatory protein [Penicillium nucicola]KAJ5758165.1 Aflatoxin biosynthesis regulatory protein [Penicillium nucicola]